MQHDGVVVMVGTAIILGLIVAVFYLWQQQRSAARALPPGTSGSGAANANAGWERILGSTLTGFGTGVAGGV